MPTEDDAPSARPSLWVVRHGETEWSADGRHTSTTDVPLTARGREEARAIGPRLARHPFAEVWSSPRIRALETGRLAGFADRLEIVDDLREWDYGTDEGRTTAEIQAERPGWSIWRDGPMGGETIEQVGERADRVVARASAAAGDVLCFAHGHLLRIVAARWLALPPDDGRLFALASARMSVLGWERETAVIDRWNESRRG
ncbi:MAG: histidine phosphatase family protein [Chloroflexi bacterium]|nr:histidine phosphatase family protein [Chloroflexota bacterium]